MGRDTGAGSGALSGGGIAHALHRWPMIWFPNGRIEACQRIRTERAVAMRNMEGEREALGGVAPRIDGNAALGI